MTQREIFTILGLMSGTSADGLDCAILRTDGITIYDKSATQAMAWPLSFSQRIKQAFGTYNRQELSQLEHDYTLYIAELCQNFIHKHASNTPLDLIGWHGQTLYHNPAKGQTIQIGNGQLLANMLQCNVAYNFRQHDVQHGGEGAPLTPIYHKALCQHHHITLPVILLNIGGISNITYISHDKLIGFDCGIGNNISDDACAFYNPQSLYSWDNNGDFAMQGTPNTTLVDAWLRHDFFQYKPPKSLDRQYFHNIIWRDCQQLHSLHDICASLALFLARSVKQGLALLNITTPIPIIILGGGAYNKAYSHYLSMVTSCPIIPANHYNINSDFIEAEAFAYLAARTYYKDPISYPTTTGVSQPLTGGIIAKFNAN